MEFNLFKDELNKFGIHYLTNKISLDKRLNSIAFLRDVIENYGSVIEGYPCWHPFVRNYNSFYPQNWPDKNSGYRCLDHTILFKDAFITCPYGNVDLIIDSIESFPKTVYAEFKIELLDVTLYDEAATPILVICKWLNHPEFSDIPSELAIPLFLEKELSCWQQPANFQNWNEAAPYYLGQPFNNLSSAFVDSNTGGKIKRLWEILIKSGRYQ